MPGLLNYVSGEREWSGSRHSLLLVSFIVVFVGCFVVLFISVFYCGYDVTNCFKLMLT